MDSFKRRTPNGQQGRTVDGFVSRPRATGHRPAGQGASLQGNRQIGGFQRADGFYAPQRRAIRSDDAAPQRSRRPSWEEGKLPNGLNLDLPDQNISRKGKKKAKQTRGGSVRKWALRTSIFSLLLVVGVAGLLFGKGYFKLHKVFQGGSSHVSLANDVDPTLLKGEGDGRVNVLLLGAGGQTHKGGDLTDTILIASIDPVNNQAVLLSIPRDLWAKMPNNFMGNYNKINAAYEAAKYKYIGKMDAANKDHKAVMAGFQGVDGVIERITGIPIHYNMLVDFKAFQQAIDTVGGVTVNTTEELRDPTMAWENNRSSVLAVKGVNNFNGKQALNFVRSRQTSSDFARGERQRQVIVALKEKTANMGTVSNPVKLSGLLSAFGDNVQSDISVSDMTRMAQIMKKIPSNQIQSVGLAQEGNSFVTTGNINGMSVVMPKAGLEDYSKIQAYIRSKLTDGYIAKEAANVTVLNGSGYAGLATTKADELKSYGYAIGTVANAPTEDYTTTKIYDLSGGTKKYTVNYLKKRFNVTTVGTQLPAGIVPGQASIVIILGTDATTNTNL